MTQSFFFPNGFDVLPRQHRERQCLDKLRVYDLSIRRFGQWLHTASALVHLRFALLITAWLWHRGGMERRRPSNVCVCVCVCMADTIATGKSHVPTVSSEHAWAMCAHSGFGQCPLMSLFFYLPLPSLAASSVVPAMPLAPPAVPSLTSTGDIVRMATSRAVVVSK